MQGKPIRLRHPNSTCWQTSQKFLNLVFTLLNKLHHSPLLDTRTSLSRTTRALTVSTSKGINLTTRPQKLFANMEIGQKKEQLAAKIQKVGQLMSEVPVTFQQILSSLFRSCQAMQKQLQHLQYLSQQEGTTQQWGATKRTEKVIQLIFRFLTRHFFTAKTVEQIVQMEAKMLAIFLLDIETKLATGPAFLSNIQQTSSCPASAHYDTPITLHQRFWDRHEYEHLVASTTIVEYSEAQTKDINEQLEALRQMMKITTSSVATEVKSKQVLDNAVLQKMVFGLSFPRFLIQKEEAHLRCFQIWRNPTVEQIKDVWNLPERGAISHCKSLLYPFIKHAEEIYIPRGIDKGQEPNVHYKGTHTDIFNQPHDHPLHSIKIRVLSEQKLICTKRTLRTQMGPFIPPSQSFSTNQLHETILIYLHGGGFVALSCDTVQTYTRKWAKQLKIPILNVDYRKPPDYTFPTPLFDCLTAYQFIVEQLHLYISNIRPKNVYLAGDSAGGNLVCALQALLLQNNYHTMPKGLFLAYPAVDLRVQFTPSRLNSFDDPLLLPSLLLLCIREYLGSVKATDPLASPLLLDYTQYLNIGKQNRQSRWPRTAIMVGMKDPLYDDSTRLHEKLIASGVDSKLIIYKQLSHGFLNLDRMLPACEHTLSDAVQLIKQLIKKGN